MSLNLIQFAASFVEGKLSANEFVDTYQHMWRQERDSDISLQDEASLSGACSTTFLLADLFNPDADREEYEFDETQLRKEVAKVLATVKK